VTVDQYVSYALSQVGDYLKGKGAKPPAKKFYHALRLMQEARRIVTHGAPRVWYLPPPLCCLPSFFRWFVGPFFDLIARLADLVLFA
jgi:hypothetical protein